MSPSSTTDTPHKAAAPLELEPHRRHLWGVCYRMTGCAADADDLVQQTFARALESPPPDRAAPMRPWLTRVAVNLARDALRARRRRGYVGPWLPSPVETRAAADDAATDEVAVGYDPPRDEGAAPRYDLLESVSFAFLLALEALAPTQRAVLILRDVFDYSVRETADALALSEANVKTSHHRARAAMARYECDRDARPRAWTPAGSAAVREALTALMTALAAQDVPAVERLLAADVRAVNDGGGEYLAARVPVEGRAKVALFHLKLARLQPELVAFALRELNGAPAVVLEYRSGDARFAPRVVVRCELAADGQIREIHTVLASRKLTAV